MIASSAVVLENSGPAPVGPKELSCRPFPWDQRERGLDRLVKPFAPVVDQSLTHTGYHSKSKGQGLKHRDINCSSLCRISVFQL